MRPIDGDRLKAFLVDSEKTLKNINNNDIDEGAWKIYIYAVGVVFQIARNAIDRMPTLETRDEG